MFSNVNEVVQQLFLAEGSNYQFVIDWSESCYRDETHAGDPWEYYFNPCFEIAFDDHETAIGIPGGKEVVCTRNNIITPRLYDNRCDPLLLPKNRWEANRIINTYLTLSNRVANKIADFRKSHFDAQIIGLHIRGAGRTHGGVPKLRKKLDLEDGVPFSRYFASVNSALQIYPEAKIFVCSDSEMVIRRVQKQYGGRVITYDSTRSEFGEMHANHSENNGTIFPPFKLGMDVLAEAYLLSEADFFVHGNSNVVNFVLCNNPTLPHDYVYRRIGLHFDKTLALFIRVLKLLSKSGKSVLRKSR